MVDVLTQGLSHLLRDEDPELARWIEELVATLKTPRQTTLSGWNSFLDPGVDST
ncbi:hypothetical protein [Micromonospora ureilytica]|uniref:Uncharacterized protein n=1 Tax=Micromonospora ureilytica TaxID=709868 RepID=A0ABS0JTH1_9ACTN|nr:hypothetical protein [Micromonospora ureilytica]MBG6070140.1 hypothetical protein [Micromonospora ureilytica]WSR56673.1 hypothetical protein OG400_00080 [Micromonospora ureilytica]